MSNDERIIVYVCCVCHKLIGTRENYHLINKGKKRYVICDGCFEDASK